MIWLNFLTPYKFIKDGQVQRNPTILMIGSKNIFFLFLLIVIGCVPVRVVDYQKNTETDLHQYKTYFYYNIEEPETKGVHFEANVQLLKKAIDVEMKKLGYTLQAAEGDLLVNIGISLAEKVQTRQTDFRTDGMRYIGQRNYHWESQEVQVDRYEEGTIVLDFINPVKKELVWQGSFAGTTTDNRKKIEARINTGVAGLFKKFPTK